jgi:hypothetical protein
MLFFDIIDILPDSYTIEKLQNTTILTGSSDHYPNKITYQAQSINVAGDSNNPFTIGAKSDGRFLAPQGIDLKPGFWAMPGSTMLAKPYSNSQGTDMKSSIVDADNDEPIQFSTQPIKISNNDSIIMWAYPNPTIDCKSTITSSSLILGNISIEIFDLLGHIIYSLKTTNFLSTSIDLSNKAKGIFLIKIRYNDNSFISKIINQ